MGQLARFESRTLIIDRFKKDPTSLTILEMSRALASRYRGTTQRTLYNLLRDKIGDPSQLTAEELFSLSNSDPR
jgi:hypothetical protein